MRQFNRCRSTTPRQVDSQRMPNPYKEKAALLGAAFRISTLAERARVIRLWVR